MVLVGGPNGRGTTTATTKSGSISLTVHPLISSVGPEGFQDGQGGFKIQDQDASKQNGTNQLATQTNSGSQTIRVQSPIVFTNGTTSATNGRPQHPQPLPITRTLDNLISSHRSINSGSLSIVYPTEWSGIVHAKSFASGSVNARGDELEFGVRTTREIYGWRGAGDDLKTVSVVGEGSGSINFAC